MKNILKSFVAGVKELQVYDVQSNYYYDRLSVLADETRKGLLAAGIESAGTYSLLYTAYVAAVKDFYAVKEDVLRNTVKALR